MASVQNKLNYIYRSVTSAWDALIGRGIKIESRDIADIAQHIADIPYTYPVQDKTGIPTRTDVTILPDKAHWLAKVFIPGAPELDPQNIRKDVSIYGVMGILNPNLEPLYDFYELVLPEELMEGTKYSKAIGKDVLFSHTEVEGIWLADFDGRRVIQLTDIGTSYNVFTEIDNKVFITGSTATAKGILVFDKITKTLNRFFDDNAGYNTIIASDNKLLITGTIADASGIIIYDRETEEFSQLFETGFNYSLILTDNKNWLITSLNTTSVSQTGLFIYNIKQDTINRYKTTGQGYSVLFAGHDFSLIRSTTASSGYEGLFLYNWDNSELTTLEANGQSWRYYTDTNNIVTLGPGNNSVPGIYTFYKDAKQLVRRYTNGYAITIIDFPDIGALFYGPNITGVLFYDYETDDCSLISSDITQTNWTICNPIGENNNYLFINLNNASPGVYVFNIVERKVISFITGVDSGRYWSVTPLVIRDNEYLLYNSTQSTVNGQGLIHYNSLTGKLIRVHTGAASASLINRIHILDNGDRALLYSSDSTAANFRGIGIFENGETKTFTHSYTTSSYNWSTIKEIGTGTQQGNLLLSSTVSYGLLKYSKSAKTITLATPTAAGIFNVFQSVGTDGDFLISNSANSYGLYFFDRSLDSVTELSSTGSYCTFYNIGSQSNNTGRIVAVPGNRSGTTSANAIGKIAVYQINGLAYIQTFSVATATHWYNVIHECPSPADSILLSCDVVAGGVLMYDNTIALGAVMVTQKYSTGYWNFYNNIGTGTNINTIIANSSAAQAGVLHYNANTKTVTQKITNSVYFNSYLSLNIRFGLLYHSSSGSTGFMLIDNNTAAGADNTKTITYPYTSGNYWAYHQVGSNYLFYTTGTSGYGIICVDTTASATAVTINQKYSNGYQWSQICVVGNNAILSSGVGVSHTTNVGMSGTGNAGILLFNGTPTANASKTITQVANTTYSSTSGSYGWNYYVDSRSIEVPNGALLCSNNSGTYIYGLWLFDNSTPGSPKLSALVGGSTTSTTDKNWNNYIDRTNFVIVIMSGQAYIYDKTNRTAVRTTNLYGAWTIYKELEDGCILRSSSTYGFVKFDDITGEIITLIGSGYGASSSTRTVKDGTLIFTTSSSSASPIYFFNTEEATFTNLGNTSYTSSRGIHSVQDGLLILGTANTSSGSYFYNEEEYKLSTNLLTGNYSGATKLIVQDGFLLIPTGDTATYFYNEETKTLKSIGSIGGGASVATYMIDDNTLLISLSSSSSYLYDQNAKITISGSTYKSTSGSGAPRIDEININYLLISTTAGAIPILYDRRNKKFYRCMKNVCVTSNICQLEFKNYLYFSSKVDSHGIVRYDMNNNTMVKVLTVGKSFDRIYSGIIFSSIQPMQVFSFNTETVRNDVYFSGVSDGWYIYNDGIIQKLSSGKFVTFNETFDIQKLINTGMIIGTTNIIYRLWYPEEVYEDTIGIFEITDDAILYSADYRLNFNEFLFLSDEVIITVGQKDVSSLSTFNISDNADYKIRSIVKKDAYEILQLSYDLPITTIKVESSNILTDKSNVAFNSPLKKPNNIESINVSDSVSIILE